MNTIYTFGYSGSTPETLKHHVETLGALLVDIRYQPWSRAPQWRQDALQDLVGSQSFRGMRTLGNINYNNGGPIQLCDPALAAYGLRSVLESRPVILLCACRDVETCHRKVAADYLAGVLGAPVEHLSGEPPAGSLGENTMRALSLTEPWALLVVIGAKRFETRSWSTSFRGPVAIHAAKTFPRSARELCHRSPFKSTLMAAGITSLADLPVGAVLGTANLVGCVPTESVVDSLSADEHAFGDYSPGRFAWRFEDPVRFAEPVPARGALGLWQWTR